MTGSTGIKSYSTTAASNVQANTGINWDEGMSPAAVNNSARANMADTRAQFNDLEWFQYGVGDVYVAHVYASGTSTTVTGADSTAAYHAGRRVKAVGSGTGTIYGAIASSSYGGGATTINYTWDGGSLSNETLTIYLSQTPVTGTPIPTKALAGAGTAWTPTDASGASLSFSSVTANSVKIGPLVFVYGTLTYPSTADTSNATIGGLPFMAPNQEYGYAPGVLSVNLANSNFQFITLKNTSTAFINDCTANAAVTNATLSGKQIRFNLVYPVV